MKYRKIYEKHFGPIPVDEDGRSYEIHHVDGNRSNNSPNNLKALSIKDHYQVHLEQGDYASCIKIAVRMKMSPEEISALATKHNKDRVAKGTHNWLGGDYQRKIQNEKVLNGTHHWLGSKNPIYKLLESGNHPFVGQRGSELAKKTQRKRVLDETHHLLSGEIQRKSHKKRLEEGNHHLLRKHICPHCNKEGKSAVMFRYHFDKCKKSPRFHCPLQ
jgi:hypothetical protein